MLGDFVNRCLLLFFGYAYPAFECFKSTEKNKINIEDVRFWCQYWIIVALITVCERFGDFFLSWLPFYGEAKLGFFIWLWYPKTKGTYFMYNTFLKPYVSQHQSEIDQKLQEVKVKVWDFAIHYWMNCTKLGSATIFQVLEQLATQSGRFGGSGGGGGTKPQVNEILELMILCNQNSLLQMSVKFFPPLISANLPVINGECCSHP
ncbi:HVA22-like protein j [Linum perenne]